MSEENAPRKETPGQPSRSPAGNTPQPRPRKRRRLLKWTVSLLVIVAILVICLPYLASTGPGTNLVANIANRWLPGTLALGDLSLGWTGPCTVNGASLTDLQGREVARIETLTYGKGLLGTITSAMRFEEVRLGSPRVSLYENENGGFSLIQAILPPKTTSDDQPVSLPELKGRLVIENGFVRIVRSDGRQLDVSNVGGSWNLDTLSNIDGTLTMQLPSSGDVSAEASIRNLAPSGRMEPFGATGTVRVSTPSGLSVSELARFLLGEVQAAGRVNLSLDGDVEKGTLRAETKTALTGVQVSRRGDAAGIEPIDGEVVANIKGSRESLTGNAALRTQAGTGQLDLVYPLAGQPQNAAGSDIAGAVLSGETAKLPKFSLDGKCRIDLARLAKAVPALLAIRQGVEVKSGTLEVENLALHGADQPSLVASIFVKDLVARSGDKDIRWEPVSLVVDAVVERGRGLKVEHGDFKAGFAQLTASGTASELRADLQADLAELHRQVGQVLDLGAMEMSGKLTGTANLKRAGENRMDFVSSVVTEGLQYRAEKRPLEIGKVQLASTGHFDMAGSSLHGVVMDAKADVDGKIIASGTSKSSMADKTYQASLNVQPADLAYIGDKLKTFGVIDASASYAGNATLQVNTQRTGEKGPVLTDGTLVLQKASVGGQPLSADDVRLQWADASVAGSQLKVKSAELASSFARLKADGVDCRFEKPITAAAALQGDADLAKLLDVVTRLSGGNQPPAIAGKLTLNANCSSAAETVRLTSNWTIDGLEIGAGEKRVREQQVKLAVDSALQHQQDTLEIGRFALDSRLLALKLGGKVSEFSTARRLAINGEYSGSWNAITALIHEFAPATKDALSIAGSTGSKFEINGSAYKPEARPVFRDVATGLDVTWDSASAYGLRLQQARISPALKQGQLHMPFAVVPATGGGQVRLGGLVDFRPDDATLLIRDKVGLMENIPVTPALGKYLLSRVNPVFGNMTRAEGSASLMVQGVELPLSEAVKKRGAGRGRLDLNNFRIAPGGFLGEAIALGGLGVEELYTVKVEGVDFVLKEGRLRYDNFALIFANDFDLRFRGSVGFDDTLDLVMSVPVRPALLERFGVRGPVAEYAKLLAGTRVEIPMVGTREQPKLDFAKVDMKPLIERAVRDAAGQKAGGLLKNLGQIGQPPQQQPQQPQSGKPPAGASPAPAQKPAEGVRNLLERGLKDVTSRPGGRR